LLDSGAGVWLPLTLDPGDERAVHSRSLTVLASLRPGATLQQARIEMNTIGDRLERADPVLNHGWARWDFCC
jgi:hypothetical protein